MIKDTATYNLLIVEDNTGDYILVEDFLEEAVVTPRVTRVEDYESLKLQLKTSPKDFDVILLDLSLPDKSGEDLIRGVFKLTRDIPVVVLTGYTDFSFAVNSLALGVSDYLLKEQLTSQVLYKSIVYAIERNKFINSLRQSEIKYSNLFHSSPLPFWVFDASTGKILESNKAACEQLGYSENEMLTLTVSDLEVEPVELRGEADQLRTDNSEFFKGIFLLRRKDGSTLYADVRHNTIEYNSKPALVYIANDITLSLKHLQAIEIQNRKLREIAWLQSHVVRAPLARIMALADYINRDDTPDKEKLEMLQHVVSSAHELDSVVRDIVSKAQRIELAK